MSRTAVASLLVSLAVAGPVQVAPATAGGTARPVAAPVAASVGYTPPVPVVVVRPFEPPPGPYAAGHRGVDLATAPGTVVRSAADGRVRFAGTVAGRGVVVIEHRDGVATEYEPVAALVTAGQAVARGQAVGRVEGVHGTCPPDRCVHWGARRGEEYLDPLRLLRPLAPVRLLPWRR